MTRRAGLSSAIVAIALASIGGVEPFAAAAVARGFRDRRDEPDDEPDLTDEDRRQMAKAEEKRARKRAKWRK